MSVNLDSAPFRNRKRIKDYFNNKKQLIEYFPFSKTRSYNIYQGDRKDSLISLINL